MTDTTIAIAPAISAINANIPASFSKWFSPGSPRKVLARALALSPREGNVDSDVEIRRFPYFLIFNSYFFLPRFLTTTVDRAEDKGSVNSQRWCQCRNRP